MILKVMMSQTPRAAAYPDPEDQAAREEPGAPAPRPFPGVRVGITGVGSALPERVMTTEEVQARVCAESGFRLPTGLIQGVTGIRSRRVCADDEHASTLAVRAGRVALARAGVDVADVDLLLFASATRDVAEPATAHIVQASLGGDAHCLDVTNACNSFVNGLDIARSMIMAGRATRALVVTGETPTRSVRWRLPGPHLARSSFAGYTFGDAGAAVVLAPVPRGGILDVDTETHSEHWEIGGIPGGGSRHPRGDEHTYFRGDGHLLREVFEKVGRAIVERLWQRTGWGWDDFAAVLVHQVTLPYLERFVEVTGAPRDRLVVTVPELGNMASATLGVQLDRVATSLRPGDRTLFLGLGGGLSLTSLVWEKS